jgi:putative lipoic acid-binding regulatory protein
MTTADVWDFPCEFPIKVVGKTNPEFEIFVLTTVRKHVPDLREDCIELRPSKEGAYLAITVKVIATSKEQLDAIYRDLSASALVSMVL